MVFPMALLALRRDSNLMASTREFIRQTCKFFAVVLVIPAEVMATWVGWAAVGNSAFAQDTNQDSALERVFWIEDLSIDHEGSNDLLAKEEGTNVAIKNAWNRLMDRLVLSLDRGTLPELEENQVLGMVHSHSLDQERFGGGRYRALLDVRFRPQAVREFLFNQNVSYSETVAAPVLVVPVFATIHGTWLWEEENLLYDALTRSDAGQALEPLVLPERGNLPSSLLSTRDVASGKSKRLLRMMDIYHTRSAILIRADLVPQGDKTQVLTLMTRTVGRKRSGETFELSEAVQPGEEPSVAIERLTHQALRRFSDIWKREHLLRGDLPENILIARIKTGSLSRYQQTELTFSSLSIIRRVMVQAVSKDWFVAELHYLGEVDSLVKALALRGYRMIAEKNSYRIER